MLCNTDFDNLDDINNQNKTSTIFDIFLFKSLRIRTLTLILIWTMFCIGNYFIFTIKLDKISFINQYIHSAIYISCDLISGYIILN